MPDYLQYFAVWTAVSVLILCLERRRAGRYASLGVFTVLCAAVAEPLGRLAGFWEYNVGPLVFGANLFTILNYFNYIIILCFVSEKLGSK